MDCTPVEGKHMSKQDDDRVELIGSPNVEISVCIATYNQERYIANCILSVIAQHVDVPIEILVGDDCSTDATGEIADSTASRYPAIVRCYHHIKNLGPSENLKFLIERASGKYIAMLDGDDMWLPGKLEAQLKFLTDHPSCVAVFTNAAIINDSGELIGVFNNSQPPVLDLEYILRRGNFLNHSSRLFRQASGSFLTLTSQNFIDYYITIGLAAQGDIGYLNGALTVYRAGVPNSMTSATPKKVQELYWSALTLTDLRSASEKGVVGVVSNFWFHVLYRARIDGDFPYALEWAKRIRKEMPRVANKSLMLGLLAFARHPFARIYGKISDLFRKRKLRVWFYR
jgi:glycosyltransferase involved in cell wall biosynthesis